MPGSMINFPPYLLKTLGQNWKLCVLGYNCSAPEKPAWLEEGKHSTENGVSFIKKGSGWKLDVFVMFPKQVKECSEIRIKMRKPKEKTVRKRKKKSLFILIHNNQNTNASFPPSYPSLWSLPCFPPHSQIDNLFLLLY